MHQENIMAYIVAQVRELLGRNLNSNEIAHRLHMNIDLVKQAMEILNKTH
jgi:DNA-directed RNA polymerase specialized sigma subunit